jgi:hypothetical protein
MDIGGAENDEHREATYRFLNAEIDDQHGILLEEARGLDTQATLVAGFAFAAVSFLLANRRETIWWFALAGYLAALALALAALWPRRWHCLVPAALRDELSEAAPALVVGRVAGSKVAIYERNSTKARTKVLLWTGSVAFLAASSGLSVWATITENLR